VEEGSVTKQYQYKVIGSPNGFPDLEQKNSTMLNQGWKPIGGIAFNQGHPYQAMAKLVDTTATPKTTTETKPRPKTFNEAMKDIDELT
jgi:hypothetical protein